MIEALNPVGSPADKFKGGDHLSEAPAMLDDNLQAQVRRVQMWMAFVVLMMIVGGMAWAVSVMSSVVGGPEIQWESRLPEDAALGPGVASLPAAVTVMDDGALPILAGEPEE